MKRALVLAGIAFLALVAQAALSRVAAPQWRPDLGLLLVVGFGLVLRSSAAGLLFAAFVGYLSDLFSGALLGQHVLLRMAAFAAARVGSRRLNLRGAMPLAVFVAALSAGHGLALYGLTAFFSPGDPLPIPPAGSFASEALVNGALAPVAVAAAARVCQALGDDEGTRLMRLEPRKFPA